MSTDTVLSPLSKSVHIAETPDALRGFLKPDCAAAVWQRDMPAQVKSWLAALEPSKLPHARVTVPMAMVAETVREIFDSADVPQGPERDWLEADVNALAEGFASLLNAKFLRIRLDPINTNACRKFHIDAITARLVCTYRGTGTQYGLSTDTQPPSDISTVKTGDPILLRGSLWPDVPHAGLRHRSPPIEGTGETRLVLVLDPVTAVED